ncbi:MAG: hypothetical protein PVI86_15305 [Phycisphaerae bacterium]|jgi:hypothetical protein
MKDLQFSIIAVAVSALTRNAGAGLVTWQFAGEVGSISDETGVLGDGVSVGDPFSGAFTFDPATADTYPDDPHAGLYVGAVTEIAGTVGLLEFSGPGPLENEIGVFDEHFVAGDEYGIRLEVELAGMASSFELIFNGEPWMFSDDGLPLVPFDLDAVGQGSLIILAEDSLTPFGISGPILSLAPEPGTFVLCVVGAVALGTNRRARPMPGRHTSESAK